MSSLHSPVSSQAMHTYSVHAGILKPWRGRLPRLPAVFSFYHVFPPPLSGLNWRSLFPLWGSDPPFPKMASPFTGSAHTPLPGSGTIATFLEKIFIFHIQIYQYVIVSILYMNRQIQVCLYILFIRKHTLSHSSWDGSKFAPLDRSCFKMHGHRCFPNFVWLIYFF